MQPRFHRANLRFSDARDFFERKILDEMQQQDGALWRRQLIQQIHKFGFLFAPDEQFVRAGFQFIRRFGDFIEQNLLALPPRQR